MKKKSLVITTVLLMIMVAPLQVVHGMTGEATTSSGEIETSAENSEEILEVRATKELAVSDEVTEERLEALETEPTSETASEPVTITEEQSQSRADLSQDAEGFWLVDSAATFTELLKDSSRLKFRLTQNIDLGTAGYRLKNGVIIDGANHIITYDKAGYYDRGLHITETNATVEIRNVQFGNTDGSNAIGYYGFLTGHDNGVNMTFIFDNVDYYSNNGQMIYNRNGSIILRGDNTIVQKGTGTYAQEWAETNYVEIQNGRTTLDHSSSSALGLIWSVSTSSGNPRANSSQLVVRKNTEMNITTNTSMTYDYLAPSYTVEESGALTIDKVSAATGDYRNSFFYMAQTQKVTFDFQKNSQVTFLLPAPINLGSASGSMTIGEGADVKIDVAGGRVFTPNTASTFALNLNQPKQVEFAATEVGTLGLNGGSTVAGNLSFNSSGIQKIETFEAKTAEIPTATILRTAADLRVRAGTYTNADGSADPLAPAELTALGTSKKIVFSKTITEPNQVKVDSDQVTDTTAMLHASSFNNGSQATEVNWFLFTSEEELSDITKAKQIISQTEFEEGNTAGASTYSKAVNNLTPNTKYWLQAVVSNDSGQSAFSEAQTFITIPALNQITTTVFDETSAVITGRLIGGSYTKVTVEYSQNDQFPVEETLWSDTSLTGANNRLFTTTVAELEVDSLYYVRVKVIGLSGEEVTLVMTPITTFTTTQAIIDVEIPIEMAFQTENRDIGTSQEGLLYSDDYHLVNRGTVPAKVSLTGIESQNEAGSQIVLRSDLLGTSGSKELALQLQSGSEAPQFITNDLANMPLTVAVLGVDADQQIRFTGKYFNPASEVLRPTYKLTFKVDINR